MTLSSKGKPHEYSNQIVGWANLKMDEEALTISPAKILDDETWKRIKKGDLKGLSVTGIVRKSECSICGKDYTECNNITGSKYDVKECVNTIQSIN